MKFSKVYKQFLAWGRVERGYARETLAKFRDCGRSWLLPILGELELEALAGADVFRLKAAMVDRGIGANRQYQVLMAFKLSLKFAREILRLSCLDPNREIRLPKRPTPHVQFLTNEEVRRVLGAIERQSFTGLRLFTLVTVLLYTGLRISEALSLNRTPFEMGQSEVEIVGKGGKQRTVFFVPACLAAIKKFLYRRGDDHEALFVTTGIPRRLSRSDISRYFKALRAKARITKPLTPHILRHTFCTNLLHNGADIRFIQEAAGHADIQTTARYYLGVDKRTVRNVVKKCLTFDS